MSERRLVLVRHGETTGNSSIRYYGRTDVALSEAGRAAMHLVRNALSQRYGINHLALIFASPLIRARESARIIAGDGAAITIIEEFTEIDFGLFEGLTAEEIAARYPFDYEHWRRNRFAPDYRYPGGESRSEFQERIKRGVARLQERWESRANGERSGHALLAAHRGVIREIARHLAAVEPAVELGSVQILEACKGRWRPVVLDAVDHLDTR